VLTVRVRARGVVPAVLVLPWLLLASCALTTSFDGYDTEEVKTQVVNGPAKTYDVSGTVSGLPSMAKVELLLNGGKVAADTLEVGDGPFTFSGVPGGSYEVTVGEVPTGYGCSVQQDGTGTLLDAGVTDVAVTCASSDATLTSLALSVAPLQQPLAPATFTYAARANLGVLPTLKANASTTVTATAAQPGSALSLKMPPTPLQSGSPSGPIPVMFGPNPFSVGVTAPDGKTSQTYGVTLDMQWNDYLKPPTPITGEVLFGAAVAIDGDTVVVGAAYVGMVYVFVRTGGVWSQQAAIQTPVQEAYPSFASSVAISGDTLAVGDSHDSSCDTGVSAAPDGTTGCLYSGATYVYVRSGTTWSLQAYVKASYAVMGNDAQANFGASVALSADTLAVGAPNEGSCANGVNGDPTNTACAVGAAYPAGAAYVFTRSGTTWSQQAYVKASNTFDSVTSTQIAELFGTSVSLSGNTLAVGAPQEQGCSPGVDGDPTAFGCYAAGAAYVFTAAGSTWSQQAYVKASNLKPLAAAGAGLGTFGASVSVSEGVLAVGSPTENSCATGAMSGAPSWMSGEAHCTNAGAAYVFTQTGTSWTQQAYLKPTDSSMGPDFGSVAALTPDGSAAVVGAPDDPGCSSGVNATASTTMCAKAGEAYLFTLAGGSPGATVTLQASNANAGIGFGASVAASGTSVIVGAPTESSCSTGVDQSQTSTGCPNAGAVYAF
jgi:hypothetical protein